MEVRGGQETSRYLDYLLRWLALSLRETLRGRHFPLCYWSRSEEENGQQYLSTIY